MADTALQFRATLLVLSCAFFANEVVAAAGKVAQKAATKPAAAGPALVDPINNPLGCGCVFADPKKACKALDDVLSGSPNDNFRVKGGTPVLSSGSIPWQARLVVNTEAGASVLCGGTLISSLFVLSAAHCWNTYGRIDFVMLGARDMEKQEGDLTPNGKPANTLVVDVEKSVVHVGYKKDIAGDDIALIKLKEKVENDWHIRPACLPPPTFVEYGNKPTGFKFKVSGWGVTETGKGANVLVEAAVPPLTQEKCKEHFDKMKKVFPKGVNDAMFCAGGDGPGACKGDSGGPLVEALKDTGGADKFYIVGVVSRSGAKGCVAKQGVPDLYTRVSSYVEWIQDTARKML